MNTEAVAERAKSVKTRRGVVTKDKMDKTVVVEVTRRVRHPKYKKFLKRRLRYKAHDENNECKVGDLVQIEECRPLSKEKRWMVKEIVEKAVDL
ncbi:MAG: 30S ribosomal protein S17 [Myxococcota bacterium]